MGFLNAVDGFLNRITMYRLMLYYLLVLYGLSLVFAAGGLLPYSLPRLALSGAVIAAASWTCNFILAKAFRVPANSESVWITALILILIIAPPPPGNISGFQLVVGAPAFAMASKFLLAFRKKHIFNPAAFGVALSSLVFGRSAAWWAGLDPHILIFTLIGGLLIARKLKRADLVLSFFLFAYFSTVFLSFPQSPFAVFQKLLLYTPAIFFAFVMLTEPSTAPPDRNSRILYGSFAGVLFFPQIPFLGAYSSPEFVLLIGNLLSWAMSPKERYAMFLAGKRRIASDVWEFEFEPDRAVPFRPGQYLEWTLAVPRADSRGNRRYFTIASSPTESKVRLGARFYAEPSAFKRELLALEPGGKMFAGQLAGNFTLPRDKNEKMAWLAGGIGITPFRSMAKFLADEGEKRDIVLLYSDRDPKNPAYRGFFEGVKERIGLKTAYVPLITSEMLNAGIPDLRERLFYISGPRAMVVAFEKALAGQGVPKNRIKTDFFPGYA